jgi:hypothetical protein
VVRVSALAVTAAAFVLCGCGGGSAPQVERVGRGHMTVVPVGAVGYTEGTESVALIEAPSDALAGKARVRYPRHREIILSKPLRSLPVGATYILRSYQQPCEAACPMTDPPTDRCSAEFGLIDGERVTATVHVTPGRGCRIKLSSSQGRSGPADE